jgi:hypothetical protein
VFVITLKVRYIFTCLGHDHKLFESALDDKELNVILTTKLLL